MTAQRPVLILQHLSGDGPAYLARWLARHGIAADVRNAEAGQEAPPDMSGHAALAVLGGEMSANDALPALRHAERLILDAMDRGRPVLGHCLGGQLTARALGARVLDSPAPEIGWQPIQVRAGASAAAWFGGPGTVHVFQWHYEAFELPAGAELLAGSAACPHQAFTIGPHLAMQFHIEVDAEKVQRWSQDVGERYRAVLHHASVQDGEAMRAGLAPRLAAHQALADRIYARWWAAAAG